MDISSFVQHISFQTPDDFLDALSPRGKYFGEEPLPRKWLFRGHGDATYQLLPKVLRLPKANEEPLYLMWNGSWFPVDSSYTNALLITSELETLIEFLNIADENGLAIPEDSILVRNKFYKFHSRLMTKGGIEERKAILEWPPVEIWRLMALAQHHGVPTRLLDWTYSSYAAAYFAAADAAKKAKSIDIESAKTKELSVWALSQEAYRFDNVMSRHDDVERTINLINVPTAGNANLSAQQGVFMLNRLTETSIGTTVDRTPLDRVIERTFRTYSLDNPNTFVPLLYHLKLPIRQAPALLRLLAKEGFTGARVFPGYNGVAKALLEQPYWDRT